MRVTKIKNEALQKEVLVSITSEDKPEISEEMQKKWQKILDLIVKIIGVSSGLITKLHEHELEVLLTSRNQENIFQQNSKFDLGKGWYCETTTGTRNELVIPNALKIEEWKNNPSIPFNMISYLGIPILWPDGEVFGTFCALDNKENQYPEWSKELLNLMGEIIQRDLESILECDKARNDISKKENQLKEIHHQVKNHFALLINTLNLQSLFGTGTQSVESILADIQARIAAISLIHDKLYRSINVENVSLGDYLSELGKYIINNLSERHVTFNCNCDEISAKAKTSVSCGLILNELITNSLKYAFAQNNFPLIALNIEKDNEFVTIIYRDNGPGLPNTYDERTTSTLGMNMVKQSVLQLGGNYSLENDNGFVFRMKFKI